MPTDNPQDDPTLETRLDAGQNPVDVMHALTESKMDHSHDMKQDHDQKPNTNLMISMNMGKLSHQVKLENDCDTGNMQMQLHTTSDEVRICLNCAKHLKRKTPTIHLNNFINFLKFCFNSSDKCSSSHWPSALWYQQRQLIECRHGFGQIVHNWKM